VKIDRASWHYRVWRASWNKEGRFAGPDATDLCHYFWRIVFYLIFCAAVSLAIIGAFGAGIYFGFIKTYVGWVVAATIALGVGLAYSSKLLHRKWRIWRMKRPRRAPKPPREPGIVLLYLKAKKQRVCPMIEFE
jgi:hypothetical protein